MKQDPQVPITGVEPRWIALCKIQHTFKPEKIMNLLYFKPVYMERVWGGRGLAERLGRKLPDDATIGESWEIVDRPEAQSVCTRTGKTLRELIKADPEGIMGPGWTPEKPFPILVKWLDCRERLSLQVHPPQKVSERLGGEPKTEFWYISETTPDAALIVGLMHGVTRAQFEQAIAEEKLEPLLHRFAVQPGQSILLESGRLHAIDAGNLIMELQENSDTTYRVYDWGRKGLDGKPRELHIQESLESIDFNDFEPEAAPAFNKPGESVLAECPSFRLRRINLQHGETLELPAGIEPTLVGLVAGRIVDDSEQAVLRRGDNALSPYAETTRLTAHESSSVLVTDHFA